jgi:hypothetical protein
MWKVFTRPTCASDFFIFSSLNQYFSHIPYVASKKPMLWEKVFNRKNQPGSWYIGGGKFSSEHYFWQKKILYEYFFIKFSGFLRIMDTRRINKM